ncbi:MAG: hypothetical protein GY811_21530 [Myxococcales bacterium]|nr:hypothetical protein [Myxococcales bacterium]
MGPIAKEVAASFEGKSVRFVTFDFTSSETKAKARADAEALGVAGTYAKTAPDSGFALVYNTKTQAIVTKLTAGQDAAQWGGELDKALAGG